MELARANPGFAYEGAGRKMLPWMREAHYLFPVRNMVTFQRAAIGRAPLVPKQVAYI